MCIERQRKRRERQRIYKRDHYLQREGESDKASVREITIYRDAVQEKEGERDYTKRTHSIVREHIL